MKKIFISLIFSVLCAAAANAQSKFGYTGFSGGMMVHTGYLFGGEINLTGTSGGDYSRTIQGPPLGIGGTAKIHLGNHLRLGTEGYVSTVNYGGRGNKSHARIGWGGLLADCIWQLGRWSPYIGGTLGGGSYSNLTLKNATPVDTTVETDASYRKYSYMIIAPFVGVECALTDKIRLNFKIDWMLNLTNRQPDFAGGPRIYLGFSFYRMKER